MDNAAKLKSMVTGDKKVKFNRYFDGCLWYETDDNFVFPVPISDIGTATFLAEDRAILFMRYIRKHLEMLDKAAKDLSAQTATF